MSFVLCVVLTVAIVLRGSFHRFLNLQFPFTNLPHTIRYHDTEWGCPVRDDKMLFELVTLECAQAGLSW